jgi:hypothetical protein
LSPAKLHSNKGFVNYFSLSEIEAIITTAPVDVNRKLGNEPYGRKKSRRTVSGGQRTEHPGEMRLDKIFALIILIT